MQIGEFKQDVDYLQSYLTARLQFKKIIKNFDAKEFKLNFDQLFFDKKNFKLFLQRGDTIVCGGLGYIYGERVFIDIFFWNQDLFEYDMHIVRIFFEKFFLKTKDMGITEAILPLDKNRKRFPSFKKHNQIFFRSREEVEISDPYTAKEYLNHHLLKVNIKKYFDTIGFDAHNN